MSPFSLIDVAQLRDRIHPRTVQQFGLPKTHRGSIMKRTAHGVSGVVQFTMSLPQAELQHLRYVRSELSDRIGSPVVGAFLPGQVKSLSDLVEQQRAIRVLIIATSLAVCSNVSRQRARTGFRRQC